MNKKILVLLVSLFLTLQIMGQVDRSKQPEAGPAPKIELGKYDTFQLDNGLKVIVVENHKLPRVAFSLQLDYDPILEGEHTGYVSLAGELLGRGTKNRTKDQIDEEVDFIGGTLHTSATGIYAASLKKHMPKLLEIMSDVLLNPTFNADELEKLKKQSISAIKSSKDSPSAIASNVQKVLDYGKDHPYGEIETEESVTSVTPEMCKDFYTTYYRPNVAYLAIVGDITLDEAKDLADKYFSDWEKAEVPAHEYKTPKAPLIRKAALVDRAASVQSVIRITYPVVLKKGSPDAIKARVMNQVLGGGASGRLFQNLREDKAFTYGAYSSLSSDELVGSFTASCEARNAVTDSAITEFLAEMKKIRKEPVGEDELNSVKHFLTGEFGRSLENPQTVARFALNIEKYNLPKDYYENYLTNLNAVTVEDVKAMAKKYVKPNNAYVLVVGNGSEVADKLKKFTVSGKIIYLDEFGNKYDPSAKALPEGVTAQTVFDNYIKAIGGKDKLLTVNDRETVMKGNIQGMELTVTVSQKKGNKFHFVLDAGVFKQTQVFDGEKGKSSANGKGKAMTEDEVKDMKVDSELFDELYFDKHDVKAELTGMEKVNGKEAYKVLLTYPSGKKKTRYYDVDSGLFVKEVSAVTSPQGSFTQTTEFKDYKDVDGIKFPFKI
ncbi:MAG: insulinase family protein, partial [Chlorobi bacterium]|nr:insulinase family protein [Chlorobiota bacterium]